MKADLFWFFRRVPSLASPILACGRRPILVLSFPRCGSTWVGSVMGKAPFARYLQEPINRSLMNRRGYPFYSDPDENISAAAQIAFRHWRWRSAGLMPYPNDWNLLSLLFGTLIVKEVALLSLPALLKYRPKIILLRRHPAAVARSFLEVGILNNIGRDPLPRLSFGKELNFSNDLTLVTSLYGYYLRKTLDTLQTYNDKIFTSFEELCSSPYEGFEMLYDFSGLKYTSQTNDFINGLQNRYDPDPLSIFKNTPEVLKKQFEGISSKQLLDIESVWRRFNLPWYNLPEDWQSL